MSKLKDRIYEIMEDNADKDGNPDWAYMENYIKAHDNNDENLKDFYKLRGMNEKGEKDVLIEEHSYGEIKMWFLSTFPEIEKFNDETKDGRDMREMSALLSDAINSIIDTKEESDIDSLFHAGGTSALLSTVSGLDDLELICFLVVR